MFVVCDWDEAKEKLKLALYDYFDDAITEVLRRNEIVIKIANHSFALLRLENINNNIELVIVGFAGDLKLCARSIFHYGFILNCKSIRCHTKRKGQLRLFNSMNLPFFLSGIDNDGFYILRADY